MNDVRTLFESVLADPPPDTLDLDQVVTRGTRRRTVRRAATAGAGLAAALVIGTGIAYVATPDETRTAPPASDPTSEPTEIAGPSAGAYTDVRCEGDTIEISPSTVAAQPFGVVLRVSSAMPAGSFLSYSSEGAGVASGEHRLPVRKGTWTLALAPGEVTLACEPRGGKRSEVVLTVTDPRDHWVGDTVPGCEIGGSPAWAQSMTGEGPTPEDAVEATLKGFRPDNDGRPDDEVVDFTARPTETGYEDGSTQSWVVLRDDEPYATIVVASQDDLRYVAMPDHLCG